MHYFCVISQDFFAFKGDNLCFKPQSLAFKHKKEINFVFKRKGLRLYAIAFTLKCNINKLFNWT